eukprot:gene19944-21897_t
MPSVCKGCGCSDIDTDPTRGGAVCTNCGSVVDDHLIVAEVEFEENSAGGANVIGQFVSAEGGNNSLQLGQNFKQSLGKDSRQHIFNNGKQMINSLGSQLKLSRHCLDSAFMFYKLAVNRRLTQGRRTIHVVGACLYLVCRTEKTSRIFFNGLKTDVFTLGRTFLALSRELCIDIPSTDPSLYIHRFAHQLNFEEKENEVATTALRLVARMKRDWMSTGRRPSGLCGAALIVAARLHGFNRTVKDVVKIVRLSRSTILQRLTDFGKTASSKLTVDEFNKIDLEEEADPPSFTKARQRAKQAQIYEEKMKLNSSELLAQLALTQERVEVVLSNRKVIEQDMVNRETILPDPAERRKMIRESMRKKSEEAKKMANEEPGSSNTPESSSGISIKSDDLELPDTSEKDLEETQKPTEKDNQLKKADHKRTKEEIEKERKEKEFQETISLFNKTQESYETENTNADSDNNDDDEDDVKPKTEEELQDCDLDLEGLDDDELDDCLLCAEEVDIKTKVWMEENGEFMEKLKEVGDNELDILRFISEKEEREALEQEKNANKKKKKKPRRKKTGGVNADTADEAIKAMLAERKLSTKINYDVLRDLTADLDLGITFDKVQPKKENQDSKESLMQQMPIVYESGPVEKKLKFRAGLKRPPSFTDASLLKKKIKAEVTSQQLAKETQSFVKIETVKFEKESPEEEKNICTRSSADEERIGHRNDCENTSFIVETGPVIVENESTNYDDDYEDEAVDENEAAATEHISVTELFGRNDFEDDYENSYDTYQDGEY